MIVGRDRFVWYILSKINMLQHNGVIPLVVFDGGRLPMKADEEDSRCLMSPFVQH
jgi:exonuclease-1